MGARHMQRHVRGLVDMHHTVDAGQKERHTTTSIYCTESKHQQEHDSTRT